MGSYFAIVTCRNSEDDIHDALMSLRNQSLAPQYVIVVDDGSSDKTAEMLTRSKQNWQSLYVITHSDLGYDISRVVKNWNEAITYSRSKGLIHTTYHMIATDDTTYPSGYAKQLVDFMDNNANIAITSGNYTKYVPEKPHGAGRFVRNSFFENTQWGGLYPELMGYESAILYESERLGYRYSILTEARFQHSRPLGKHHKFYEFGASMKTLGYHPVFVWGRFAKYLATGEVTGRTGAFNMLYYYLSYKPKTVGYDRLYNDQLRKFVRETQKRRMISIISGRKRHRNQI
ncbi:MAG TPA: glycosyltransferase family A protein [Nitrososphaeraceae archaeon]|nr:glycosyltransferase family A protein [Nitrososphaeraceae archaeon]